MATTVQTTMLALGSGNAPVGKPIGSEILTVRLDGSSNHPYATQKGGNPNERDHISETEAHIRIPHITQRKARAQLLQHDVIRRGPMLECQRCGQFWESTASSMIFSKGICPGPKIYGTPQKERPWIIPAKRCPI